MNIQDGIGTNYTTGVAGRAASIVDLAEDLCNVRIEEKDCLFVFCLVGIIWRFVYLFAGHYFPLMTCFRTTDSSCLPARGFGCPTGSLGAPV